jgi:hypothetical protein
METNTAMLGGDNACLIEPAALAKSASRSAQAVQRKPFNASPSTSGTNGWEIEPSR